MVYDLSAKHCRGFVRACLHCNVYPRQIYITPMEWEAVPARFESGLHRGLIGKGKEEGMLWYVCACL